MKTTWIVGFFLVVGLFLLMFEIWTYFEGLSWHKRFKTPSMGIIKSHFVDSRLHHELSHMAIGLVGCNEAIQSRYVC